METASQMATPSTTAATFNFLASLINGNQESFKRFRLQEILLTS